MFPLLMEFSSDDREERDKLEIRSASESEDNNHFILWFYWVNYYLLLSSWIVSQLSS